MSIIKREAFDDRDKIQNLNEVLRLYAVTDRTWTNGRKLAEQVSKAIDGGVTCVQLREKELCGEPLFREAREIASLCKERRIPFIINDNVQLAVLCNADGVHAGQDDMNVRSIRRIVGDKMTIGISVQTVRQAIDAELGGADYLGAGAMFATDTKADADNVSFETLKDICRAVSIPVIAIGGINENNIGLFNNTGIVGVAVVSAIFSKSDECAAAARLRAKCDILFSQVK